MTWLIGFVSPIEIKVHSQGAKQVLCQWKLKLDILEYQDMHALAFRIRQQALQVTTIPKETTGMPRAHATESLVKGKVEVDMFKGACVLLQVALDPAERSVVQGGAVEAVGWRV